MTFLDCLSLDAAAQLLRPLKRFCVLGGIIMLYSGCSTQGTSHSDTLPESRMQRPIQTAKTTPSLPTSRITPEPKYAAEPAQEVALPDLQAQPLGNGWRFTLDDPFFSRDKTEVVSYATPHLQQIVQMIEQYPNSQVLIEGYVNQSGNMQHVNGMSQRLADAVLFALAKRGVPSNRMKAVGLGQKALTDALGRSQKRQVQISMSY